MMLHKLAVILILETRRKAPFSSIMWIVRTFCVITEALSKLLDLKCVPVTRLGGQPGARQLVFEVSKSTSSTLRLGANPPSILDKSS